MWLSPIIVMALSFSSVQNLSPAKQPDQNLPDLIIDVMDPTGAVIPKANISALAEDGSAKVVAITNSEGRATVRGLRPGTYTIAASAQGFRASQKTIQLSTRPTTIQLKLDVGSYSGPEIITPPPVTTDETLVNPEITPYPILPLPKKKKRH